MEGFLRCSLPSPFRLENVGSKLPASSRQPLLMPSGAELSALRMPVLHCSFPSLLHPQYEAVREQCEGWIVEVAKPPSAAARRFLQDCMLPRFACRVIPNPSASLHRLIYATKMFSWLFIADDDDDHPDALGADNVATARRVDTIMAILRRPSSSAADHELLCSSTTSMDGGRSYARLQALAALWGDISEEISPCLRHRFIAAMADYLEGVKVQAMFRKAKCLPSIKDYLEIRRKSSFTLPAFVLMEFALGLELNEATYTNPLMIELQDTARDFINLCNDIISYPIEIGVGDYFNLPSILYTSKDATFPCSSFQDALDLVAHMAHDLNAHFVSLLPSLHPFLIKDESYLFAYVEALSSCMSGSLAWFLETARYHDPSTRSELYQPKCIMHHEQKLEMR